MIPVAEESKELGAEMVDAVQRDGGGARQRRDGVDAENPRGESPAGPVSEAERPGKTGALSWEDRVWIALDVCATAMLFGYSAWKCIGWRELVAKGGMIDWAKQQSWHNGNFGAMGYCIGGHLAFRAALNPNIKATACFYATDLHTQIIPNQPV